jgi:hypothetical protein
VNKPILKAESINERLQRRAGRSERAGEIDLSGAARIEIVRPADPRHDRTVLVVDREHGKRNIGAERERQAARPLARKLFQASLQIGINGEPHFATLPAFSDGPVGRVRRQHRHQPAARRHGFAFGRRDFVSRRV